MKSHIEFAAKNGVNRTVFDGEDELHKLAEINKTLPDGHKLELLLRIATDDEKSVCSFSNKFGCPPPQAPALLEVAKELNLNVVGVSFHVGSGCGDEGAYMKALNDAYDIFVAADRLEMPAMTLLDIGGGFPGDNLGTYREDAPTFTKIAKTVRAAISNFESKFESQTRQFRYIAEPGRYFVSRSTTIASKVYGRKGGKGNTQALYIDNGVYGSFNNVVYDHFNPIPMKLTAAIEKEDEDNAEMLPTAIFGPTCDGLDQICEQKTTLLPRTEVDDWLLFDNMGAYTHTASFVFNGYTHMPKLVHCITTTDYETEDQSQ
jgi:ornithine decarboxylase